ncbi:MAG: hypothetical protein ACRDQ0_16610 [Pseudonocardia sp.]
MAIFALCGFAAVGVVVCAACVAVCLYYAVTARRRGQTLADMPGHPERLRRLDDPVADSAFWDLAQELLDDPEEPRLVDVCEELGWLR